MKKHLWTLAFLTLALILYSIGMAAGAVVLLLMGFGAEIAFWISLFTKTER